jgi:tRNA A37 threonylcarbamoyladenosine biosynthesis protein TsaE
VEGLGGNPDLVSSPTFVLLQSYDCGAGEITVLHHVDLYRLAENVADLREIGLEDTLSDPSAVIAVEWPKDTLATWIPADARTWRVAITTEDDDSRRIEVTPPS